MPRSLHCYLSPPQFHKASSWGAPSLCVVFPDVPQESTTSANGYLNFESECSGWVRRHPNNLAWPRVLGWVYFPRVHFAGCSAYWCETLLGTFQRLFLVKPRPSMLCLRRFMAFFLYFQMTWNKVLSSPNKLAIIFRDKFQERNKEIVFSITAFRLTHDSDM